MVKFSELWGEIRRRVTPTTPTRPILDLEVATDETSLMKMMPSVQYIPDALISKKKIDIFNEMMLDNAVEGAINALKTIRLSSGWELNAASEDTKDNEIKKFVQYNLENIEGSFEDDLREILGAVELGISLSELNWRTFDEGEYSGKIGLKSIKSKNPKFFNVYVDDFDNIMEMGVIPLSGKTPYRPMPTEKFVIYSFNKKYENVFGVSRLRTLYKLWFLKQVFVKAWGVYMEKFGHPIAKAKYPAGIDATTKATVLDLVRQLRTETGIALPEGIDLEIMPTESKGSDVYLKTIDTIDEKIRQTILGQTLTSGQGDVGSYALGKVHMDIFQMYIEQLGRDVAEKAVNEQIIKRLVYYNYGAVECPKFVFKSLIQDDVPAILEKYYAGVQNGAIKPIPEDEAKIREMLKFPKRNTENDVMPEPPKQSFNEKKNIPSIKFAEKIFKGVRRRTFTEYEEAVDFNNIMDIQDTAVDKYVPGIAALVRESLDEVYKEIEKKRIIDEKNIPAIDKLHLKYLGDIKGKFNDMFVKIYEQGMRESRKEIIEKKRELKFQEVDFRNITPKEAMEYFAQKSYFATQLEKDYINKVLKNQIFNAIKNGKSIKEFINDTEEAFKTYFNAGMIADDYLSSARLETIIRTNVSEAFNEGRKAFFESPDMKGYVVAYQYSAILDDRVRPSHAEMDERIYAMTNPVWDLWTPPNGYNCRCLLIPITADDEWEESKPIPSSLQPDAGFK